MLNNHSSSAPPASPRAQLTRGVSLQSLVKAVNPPPPQVVKTKDIYGFEVDAKRSSHYRAFYEKFFFHSQRQSLKTGIILDSGVLKNWNCIYARGKTIADNPDFDKVATLVRDGLPLKSRGEIWLQLTGVGAKVKLYQGVYESLLEPYEQAEQYGINSSPSTIQIEKDVPRTFPGYVWTPKGKKFQPALRRLLRAYAMRNPRLGYCQSMNFIAGGLLLFLDEAEAFWMLCFIVEEMLPDYFTRNIIGPQIDAEVLTELMAEELPALRDHFEAMGVNTVLVSTQWFMCLFIRTLPFECAFRVWDSLFLYGPQVLFEVGLSVLKMHQTELLTFEDTIDIVSHLTTSLSELFDCTRIWDVPITRLDHKRVISSREIQKEKVLRDMRMKADILDLMDAIPHSKFSREALEDLYVQYANLSPQLNDIDVVGIGLSKAVFQKVILRICQWQYEEYFMDRLFLYFDSNRNQRIDFKELISGLSVLVKGTNDEKLKLCFVLFDKNSDGYVDREELHSMLTALYTLCNNSTSVPQPTRATLSGGAVQSNRLSGGSASSNALSQSAGAQPTSNRHALTMSGGAIPSIRSMLTMSGGALLSNRHSAGSTTHTNAPQLNRRSGESSSLQLNMLVLSDGAAQMTQDTSNRLTSSGGAGPLGHEPEKEKSAPDYASEYASEPEKGTVAPDYASEVAFFVDMLFRMADVTRDGLLSPDEFREAALLHPYILKTFNLDHQQNYDVRISIG